MSKFVQIGKDFMFFGENIGKTNGCPVEFPKQDRIASQSALLDRMAKARHLNYLDSDNILLYEEKVVSHIANTRDLKRGFEIVKEWENCYDCDVDEALCQQGVIIVTLDSRDYLYSYHQGKILSYGFSAINIKGVKGENLVEVCSCLSVEIRAVDPTGKTDVTHSVVGYVDLDGNVITDLINTNTSMVYPKSFCETDMGLNRVESSILSEVEFEVHSREKSRVFQLQTKSILDARRKSTDKK